MINRFQFQPIVQRANHMAENVEGSFDKEDADPRTDSLFVHNGYSRHIPMSGSEGSYYVHEATGRKLSTDEYRTATRMTDRAMDNHYGVDDE